MRVKRRQTVRAAFLDRDGVLNERPLPQHHVERPEDLHVLPKAPMAVEILAKFGFMPIIVSNQRLVDPATLLEIENALAHGGVHVLASYYCVHDYDEGCECRKPKPGLLIHAQRDYDIDMSRSVLIGDSESDMQAGSAVGCQVFRVSEFVTVLDCAQLAVAWASR